VRNPLSTAVEGESRAWTRSGNCRIRAGICISHQKLILEAAGIAADKKGALFRTAAGRTKTLTTNRLHRTEALLMIKRRARVAGLPEAICCHTFRATGITAYLENGGTIEKAQMIAAHASPRTTKLYDRTQDQISLDEVERITI
jgi:integrase/recombinase XerD